MDALGEVRRRRGVAYYHQLYTLLVTALGDGLFTPGSALPTETELMGRFRVSRNTVRRALARLEDEKRIVRRRGSGSYARSPPQPGFSPDTIAEILQDFDATSSQTSTRLLRIEPGATPEYIRRRDPNFGERSVMVQRMRSFKKEPFLLSTSYVPERLATRLTRQRLSRKTVLTALDELGITPVSAEQTTTAVGADAIAARHLSVDPAFPLLCIQRLVRDGEGRSIEHQSYLYRPDRCDLRVNVSLQRTPSGLHWSPKPSPALLPAWL
ncbi:MAG: GntR family transcriptional regulator [Gammaproteobacteria bacterium]|nr:GntR family transcriptional regulator [Gammaproteobacteria bacterium]